MTNLLSETSQDILKSGHTADDIIFIGSEESGHQCTWDEFKKLADQVYDSGFGAQKVATDLIIVFKDGTKMWRGEYDGSEGWDYSSPFKKPLFFCPIKTLFIGDEDVGWMELKEINKKVSDGK